MSSEENFFQRGLKICFAILLMSLSWSCSSAGKPEAPSVHPAGIVQPDLSIHDRLMFSGTFLQDTADNARASRLGREASPDAFHQLHASMKSEGYQISDFELVVSGGSFNLLEAYVGLWEPADDERSFLLDLTRARLEEEIASQQVAGFVIDDLEVYEKQGEIRYAAIWRLMPGATRTASFHIPRLLGNNACPPGHWIEDIEINPSGETFTAICQVGEKSQRLIAKGEWADFLERAQELLSEGKRLVDFESSMIDGRKLFVGLLEEAGGLEYLYIDYHWEVLLSRRETLGDGRTPRPLVSKHGGELDLLPPPRLIPVHRRLIDIDVFWHGPFPNDLRPTHTPLHDGPVTRPPDG